MIVLSNDGPPALPQRDSQLENGVYKLQPAVCDHAEADHEVFDLVDHVVGPRDQRPVERSASVVAGEVGEGVLELVARGYQFACCDHALLHVLLRWSETSQRRGAQPGRVGCFDQRGCVLPKVPHEGSAV